MTDKERKFHKIFMTTAFAMAEMSHCVSHKVGAVLVKDTRIVSTGYNGTPMGYINCDKKFQNYTDKNREDHHKFSEMFEIHAELNAILCAAKNGVSIDHCILYCTLQPCNNCLKIICNTGIKQIYYCNEYDKSSLNQDVLDMLKQCRITLTKLNINETE